MHMANECHSRKKPGKPARLAMISRQLLWEGGLVKFYVPKDRRNAWVHRIPEEDAADTFKYLCINHQVKGGEVHLHLHARDPIALRGEMVLATLEVWRTRYLDDSHAIHVDLRWPRVVKSRNRERTHKFRIVSANKCPQGFESASRLELPPPLEGAVLILQVATSVIRYSEVPAA